MSVEASKQHTGLLRLGLIEPESAVFWSQSLRELEPEEQIQTAAEEEWFGRRSQIRLRYLLLNLNARFDVNTQRALRAWNPSKVEDRKLICHWHLQLSDPLYRSFTSTHLPARREAAQPTIDRDAVLQWVNDYTQNRWAPITALRMASALLTCLNEVGFGHGLAPIRPLLAPPVSDAALGYLLYLLRESDFTGTLGSNPYLASLDLEGDKLRDRLSSVAGVKFARPVESGDLQWEFPDLLNRRH